MMLQLQDSPLVLLSGKKRQERRAVKQAAKKQIKAVKQAGKVAKATAKVAKKVARKEKKAVTVQGKVALKKAKTSKKVNVQKAKEERRVGTQNVRLKKKVDKALSPIDTPDDGSTPMPGGSPFPSGGGGGGNPGPYYGGEPEEEEGYDEFEEVPEESEEWEEEGEPEYEEEMEMAYDEMNDQYSLEGGIWDTAFTAIKGAARGAVNEFKGKAKTAISKKIPINTSSALQRENQALKNELAKFKDSQPYKMGGSALAGTLAGFIIGKILK